MKYKKSVCARCDLHWCTTFSKDHTHCSLAITATSVKFFQSLFFCEIRRSLWSILFGFPMGYSNLPSLVEIFRVSQLWRSLGRHFRFKGVYKRLATEYNHSATLKQCKTSFRVKAAWPTWNPKVACLNTERTYKWKLSGSARQSEIGILCFDWLIYPGVSYSREIWIFSEQEGSFKAFYGIQPWVFHFLFNVIIQAKSHFAIFQVLLFPISLHWIWNSLRNNSVSFNLHFVCTIIALKIRLCSQANQNHLLRDFVSFSACWDKWKQIACRHQLCYFS